MSETGGDGKNVERPQAPAARRTAAPAGTVIAVLVGLVVFLYLIRTILLPFVIAGIVAFICVPLVDWLKERLRVPRWMPAVGVLLAVVALAAIVGLLGIPPLLHEISRVAGNLGGTIESLVAKIMGGATFELMGTTVNASAVADYTVDSLRGWFETDARVLVIATAGFAWVFGSILTIVLLGYFLVNAPRLGAGLFWLVPPARRPFAARAWEQLSPVLRRYFVGVGLVVVYASVAAYIGLGLALGLSHAVVLALLTGFLEVIPVVGPAASAVVAGLVAVQEAASGIAIIGYVIYAAALRISIDQFFGPIVLGRAGHIPPVLVIFCFLAGGLLFGIVGVVLAVPVALTIRILLRVLYEEDETPDPTPTESGA